MRGRILLATACGALVSCHMILGVGELDAPKSSDDDEDASFEWDFDAAPPKYDASVPMPEVDSGGSTQKRVFVTASTFPPNFGSVPAGSALCQTAATNAGLGGTWIAWLSDSQHRAIDALADAPYVLVTGVPLVTNKQALLGGSLGAAINVVEDGGTTTGTSNVWTGTFKDGTIGDTCANWTTNSILTGGTQGSANQATSKWTDNGGQPNVSTRAWQCSQTARLYCFEQ